MMSDVSLETCWAFNVLWNNKFRYQVASCWLLLLSHVICNKLCNSYRRYALTPAKVTTVIRDGEYISNITTCRWNLMEKTFPYFNPLKAELNPICHLLALLGVHHILHVSRIRVNSRNSPVKLNWIYVQVYCVKMRGVELKSGSHQPILLLSTMRMRMPFT